VAVYSKKHNVTVWHPSVCLSVCPVGMLIVTHQEAAGNTASICVDLTIYRTVRVQGLIGPLYNKGKYTYLFTKTK